MAIEERASVCTFDCPDTCSLDVGVDDGRIVKVRGTNALPYTAKVICNKVAREMGAFVHGPQRLLHPLRRIGPKGSGQFERISWEEALDEIYDRVGDVIGRWGPEAVMPLNYAGPHGMLAGDSMSLRFFHKLGATQLFRGSLCGRCAAKLGWEPMATRRGSDPRRPAMPRSTWFGATTPRSRTCISFARSARRSARAAASW